MDRKEEILQATLKLVATQGMGNLSLSQVADSVGIKKASLYNHFHSKEELITGLYEYLRESAVKRGQLMQVDFSQLVRGRKPAQVLQIAVQNYGKMVNDGEMKLFYRMIISERTFSKEAAEIMVLETDRMIWATKQLFYAMQVHGLMNFNNIDSTAVSFALTINGLLNYQLDQKMTAKDDSDRYNKGKEMLEEYIASFCNQYAVEDGGKM